MGHYKSCKYCHNTNEGDSVYQCQNCRCFFCEDCTVNGDAGPLSFPGACPNCEKFGRDYKGSIQSKQKQSGKQIKRKKADYSSSNDSSDYEPSNSDSSIHYGKSNYVWLIALSIILIISYIFSTNNKSLESNSRNHNNSNNFITSRVDSSKKASDTILSTPNKINNEQISQLPISPTVDQIKEMLLMKKWSWDFQDINEFENVTIIKEEYNENIESLVQTIELKLKNLKTNEPYKIGLNIQYKLNEVKKWEISYSYFNFSLNNTDETNSMKTDVINEISHSIEQLKIPINSLKKIESINQMPTVFNESTAFDGIANSNIYLYPDVAVYLNEESSIVGNIDILPNSILLSKGKVQGTVKVYDKATFICKGIFTGNVILRTKKSKFINNTDQNITVTFE